MTQGVLSFFWMFWYMGVFMLCMMLALVMIRFVTSFVWKPIDFLNDL